MATQHINQDPAQYVLLTPARHGPISKLDRIMHKLGDFIMEQWATIITVVLGILVFLAVSVPFLSYFGLDSIAKPIFFALHTICAQIPSHSFYIFGHQLGFCERNLSIYTSMFVGSLIFVLSKKRLPGIPWWVWLLMILPMAWDGLTQMFGFRESDATLRVLTGTLFGLANTWFALPLMHKTLQEPPPPQVQVQLRPRRSIPTTTQLSGIERIAMAIRSILPTHKQHKDSVHHAHNALAHNQQTDQAYYAHASSTYNSHRNPIIPMDQITRTNNRRARFIAATPDLSGGSDHTTNAFCHTQHPAYFVHPHYHDPDSSNNVLNNSGKIPEE